MGHTNLSFHPSPLHAFPLIITSRSTPLLPFPPFIIFQYLTHPHPFPLPSFVLHYPTETPLLPPYPPHSLSSFVLPFPCHLPNQSVNHNTSGNSMIQIWHTDRQTNRETDICILLLDFSIYLPSALISIPSMRSSILNLSTSAFSSLISRAFGSSLTTALHMICFARSAYLRQQIK